MSTTTFATHDIVVGRVVSEDDGFMLLGEIAKNEERKLSIEEGDRFYTLVFVRMNDSRPEFWKPW